jgi:hypothetical protein
VPLFDPPDTDEARHYRLWRGQVGRDYKRRMRLAIPEQCPACGDHEDDEAGEQIECHHTRYIPGGTGTEPYEIMVWLCLEHHRMVHACHDWRDWRRPAGKRKRRRNRFRLRKVKPWPYADGVLAWATNKVIRAQRRRLWRFRARRVPWTPAPEGRWP